MLKKEIMAYLKYYCHICLDRQCRISLPTSAETPIFNTDVSSTAARVNLLSECVCGIREQSEPPFKNKQFLEQNLENHHKRTD
jgi:hypothetical protein